MGSTHSITMTADAAPAAEPAAPEEAAATTEAATTEATVVAEAPAEPSAPTPEAAAEPQAAATAEPEAPAEPEALSLDGWDGNLDSIPEVYRDSVAQAVKYFDAKQAEVLAELETLRGRASDFDSQRAVYEALMSGDDDPRIDALTTKVAESNVARETIEAEAKRLQAEFDAYKAAVDRAEEAFATRTWEAFEAAHPAIAKDTDLVGELLDEGWDLDDIPKLAALNKKAAEAARELVKTEGIKPALAAELATVRHPDQKERSRAAVVAGTNGPHGNVSELNRGAPLNESYSDKRERLLRRVG